MIKRQFGKLVRPVALLVMLLTVGCAQQMQTVKPDAATANPVNAEIKSITVADDASRIEIISDKPIVYTYYMLETPPRLVVDLAQTSTGTFVLPIDVNRGSIKRIVIARHEFGSGVLSRIEVLLSEKVEAIALLDQQNKNRLFLNIPAPSASRLALPSPATETVQVVDPQPVIGENKENTETAGNEPGMIPAAGAESGSGASGTGQEEKIAAVASGNESVKSEKSAPMTPAVAAKPVAMPLKSGERRLTAINKNEDSIQLEISGGIDGYKSFKLTQPERLVIDIPKTKSVLPVKVVDVNGFGLGKARIGGSPEKLRIVFDALGATIPYYTIAKNEAGLRIAFGEAQKTAGAERANHGAVEEPKAAPAVPVAVSAPAAPVSDTKAPARSGTGAVEAVEFSRADGLSRITVKTTGDCDAGKPLKSVKGYTLTIKNCLLPVNLQRQLDTSGFDSAIKNIAPFSVKAKKPETRIAVNLRGTLPNSLRREGEALFWDFSEPLKAGKSARPARVSLPVEPFSASATSAFNKDIAETSQDSVKNPVDKSMDDAFTLDKVSQQSLRQTKKYSGRKVTLEFADADIRKIFQLLAEVSNQNFLMSDDVTGTISLKLVNVPWDQALDVILENKNLGMQREGNIVQIRPKTKMKSLDDEAVEMRFTEEKRMPLSTVIFDINYAELDAIKTQFMQLKSKRTDASVTGDIRTNKMIVVDIDPNIRKMRSLLESLDVPEKQVMIEARIVEAETSFARDLGVKWNFGYQDGSASVANINNLTGSMGGVVSPLLPTLTTGGISAGVSFGKLISNIQLDMRLSAAASVGQVKIISTPKVMTVNNKPAKISQGQMIPYQNTSSTDGAKTEFIEAALSLEVTPHITADGSVGMKIKASNNTAGVGNPPPINKKEATTELVVKNGETTVIGGIYVDRDTDGDTGVPYLSEIPLLGYLFKSNSKSKTKNELLIFITPKIMN